ncbi:hypothetical protein [uncultured Paludibaculum sp.]|uniref:phosphorylase family protein n=1 Tax=uncultured Paludibaculum sp. TaxID=1765020 RepID=UPI002AAB1C41|nr:hypothetical protein [uncultured Paludibaculum sp.]
MDTVDGNPIVAIAAEAREFEGLLRHASSVSELDWPVQYARRAEIRGSSWVLSANGPGPKLAGAAAEVAARQCDARAFVSTGFCGALDPALDACQVFVASSVEAPEQGRSFASRHTGSDTGHAAGRLLSVDRVAVTAAEKAALWADGAAVVEMEAAAVAERAERSETPFYCIRVVSDTARDEMPLDFNLYRDSDGRFSRGRIVAAALMRPACFAGLLRLDAHCRRASANLGDFLADCRF